MASKWGGSNERLLEFARGYFRQEAVGAEVRLAADRSIRSPRYRPCHSTLAHRNFFAMCFRLMRDYPAQLEQMDLIGPMITRLPWGYQGRPRAAYERAREMALTKARASG